MMNFQPRFPIIARPMASMILIIAAAALQPVCATELKAESAAERYVLDQVQNGGHADLERKFPADQFPDSMRELRGSFIAALLTNRDARLKIPPHGVSIEHAIITGVFDLIGEEIPYDVSIVDSIFKAFVNFSGSHFARGLEFKIDKFEQGVSLSRATIDYDLFVSGCRFSRPEFDVSFYGVRVGRDFTIGFTKFETRPLGFSHARVGGVFELLACSFSHDVFFDDMRVDGAFSAKAIFRVDKITFAGSHFGDLLLNESDFNVSAIDFSRVQTDFFSFDDVSLGWPPPEIKLEQMTFKRLSPVDPDKLQSLLSHYNADFYANLETWFRTHGYPDQADGIFIARQRAERSETCKDFLRQCNRGAWAFSLFEDMLAGYGKSLQNLLYWSLGFLVIGMFVFRSEKGMRIKDPKDAPHYAGRYHAFWYSLDLFLPIIKLGEADVWTPKDDRRWANLYRKVHIIIGSLFVPIGLAAWTGIIR
jgi:hypothetical protein